MKHANSNDVIGSCSAQPENVDNRNVRSASSVQLLSVTISHQIINSSAVVEMGDRLATIDTGRKLGAVPLWEELGPRVTQCGLG